jgi:hypothetical protein
MLEVKSEKMVKCFFPKSCLDDLGGVIDGVPTAKAPHCFNLHFP